jgi:hypothetical protein
MLVHIKSLIMLYDAKPLPTATRKIRTIRDMPDPGNVYKSTLGHADLSKSWLDIPNVRDGNGALITPEEYDEKLTAGTIVMVNVYMKL